ncbi:hypothetical protein EDD80_1023 [Anseongella ginsenosidimutans]|uniref:Uncharacterized protein n=1 Tax=Anseongella ginsenosidimutans TaxID=496056 RepID=A0A4V2UU29_9SPHI|nr:hypothetical protein [Anseongella ginsenosidimutans]QEC51501.1 hypothetical protein FRZ59_03455 [Anseongella ginsenosidimutans]TCS88813.1 hypothetical protein EDD80_1023 [Anseongella ginsenosidimutans]
MLLSKIKIASAAIAIFAVTAVLAFTPDENASQQQTQWFTYTSGPIDEPASYSPAGSSAPSCPGATNICAIRAATFDNKPVITQDLEEEMQDALSTGDDLGPNVRLQN